jgi:hypothetical protein
VEAAAGVEQSQLEMFNKRRTGKIAVGRGKVFHAYGNNTDKSLLRLLSPPECSLGTAITV